MVTRTKLGHKLNAKVSFRNHPYQRPFLYGKPATEKSTSVLINPSVDLKKFDNLIMDQGTEGDCVAAASGGVWAYLQILIWRLANPNFTDEALQAFIGSLKDVSRDFIYALCLYHDGDFGQDEGSFGMSGAYVLENFGACYENVWPNDGNGFRRYPTNAATVEAAKHKVKTYTLRNLDEVKRSHSEGYPTFAGFPVFGSWVNTLPYEIPLPSFYESVAGGHEMKTIGHDDETQMLDIDNSWGVGVGNGGRFKMSYEYYEKYASDIHTARLIVA